MCSLGSLTGLTLTPESLSHETTAWALACRITKIHCLLVLTPSPSLVPKLSSTHPHPSPTHPSPMYSHASLHTHFVITLNYVVELAPPSPSRSNYSHSYLHENITQWLRRRLVLFFAPRTSKKVCFGERREDERREKWGG